jgi:hypothetical protein
MRRIATTFDVNTGRFSLAEPIPHNALEIYYGVPQTTVYERGDVLPVRPVEPPPPRETTLADLVTEINTLKTRVEQLETRPLNGR